MQLYPALDLRGGQIVRLLQGDYARETRSASTPQQVASSYRDAGASWLHVVDLDGAKHASAENLPLIAKLARATDLHIQTGGGVRSAADVQARLAAGAKRVVVGSAAIMSPDLVCDWLQLFGAEALCLALDCRTDAQGSYRVHVSGWQEASAVELFERLAFFADAGFKHALVTDIARDGMLSGPNVGLYAQIAKRVPAIAVQASGGIAELSDLHALKAAGAPGAIIGKALLEGRFTLQDALRC